MRSVRSKVHAVLAGTFIAAIIASTPGAAAASATTTAPSLYAPSVLVLTVAKGTEPEPVQRAAVLGCTPRGGDHPFLADACTSLEAAEGNVAKIAQDDRTCTYEYRPVTVTARGVWHGEISEFQATYPNRCVMLRSTGTLFSF